jgi:hypothetical protein
MATTEETTLTANEVSKKFLLLCKDIDERFKQYVVLTTNKNIIETVTSFDIMPKERVLSSYEGSYRNLIKYTDEQLHSHYKNNTKDWKNWCDDVAIYYSSRLVLYQKIIPIMNYEKFENQKEADEALLQAFEEQKTKEKKQSIQDLTRKANKKKAEKDRLRKEYEKSAAEKELEKLKEKKKKQQKKSSKA